MFTVHGYVDGVTYGLLADPEVKGSGKDGIVLACSPPDALDVLRDHLGQDVRRTPTSATVPLALDDADALIAGLQTFTRVTRVTGQYPAVDEGDPPPPADAHIVY